MGYVNTIEGIRDEMENIEATLDSTPIDEVLSQAIILANTNPEVLEDASIRDLGHFRSVLAASIQRVEAKGAKDRSWNRTAAIIGAALGGAAGVLTSMIQNPQVGVSMALGGLLFIGTVMTIVSVSASFRGGGWSAVSPHLQRALALVDAERAGRRRTEPLPYRTEERRRIDAAQASTPQSSAAQNGDEAEAQTAAGASTRRQES